MIYLTSSNKINLTAIDMKKDILKNLMFFSAHLRDLCAFALK